VLYHGTATRFQESILKKGLLSCGRQYVHLSKDVPTALNVGSRHGKPIVFQIDTRAMQHDGLLFYLSANGVWLVDYVPTKYLKMIEVST